MKKMIATLVASAFLMTAPAMAAQTMKASPAPKAGAKTSAKAAAKPMTMKSMKSMKSVKSMKPAPKATKKP